MEKVITIGDYQIPVRSTAAFTIRYKDFFQRDALKDLIMLAQCMRDEEKRRNKAIEEKRAEKTNEENEEEEPLFLDGFESDIFLRCLWVFAKTADRTIPTLLDWLDDFEIAPVNFIFEVLPQVSDMLADTMKTQVQAKKKPMSPTKITR